MGIASCVWLIDDTVTLEEYVPYENKQIDDKEINQIKNSTILESPKAQGSKIIRTIAPVGKDWPKNQRK